MINKKMQKLGKTGGLATVKKYGSKHFSKIAKKSWKIRREKQMLSKA